MNFPIDRVFSAGCTLVGTIVGGIVGYYISISHEHRVRRRAFRDFMTSLSDDFEQASDSEIVGFQRENKHSIRSECCKVLEDVRVGKKRQLLDDRDKFCSLKESDLVVINASEQLNKGTHTKEGKETERSPWVEIPGREKIRKLLESIKRCAQ